MRYLTVTAHPDDEVLGFGGTSTVLTEKGHVVKNCILSGKVEVRAKRPELDELSANIQEAQKLIGAEEVILGDFPNIQFNTVSHIELVKFIEQVVNDFRPDYIFTHHPGDLNNDHLQVSQACQAAARLYQRRNEAPLKGLFFMEILSSTDWSFPGGSSDFEATSFFEIGEKGLKTKLEALHAYKGIMRDYPHPRSEEVVRGLSAYRGSQAGLNYAEAFQTASLILEWP